MKFIYLSILVSLFLAGCSGNKDLKVERAFYYWKGSYFDRDLTPNLKDLSVKKIYYKVFEVDYSEAMGNFPYSKNVPHKYTFNIDSLEIVPTVFIKNEIFKYNDKASLDKLADNIVFLVDKYIDEKEFIFKEIQIDCDWTKSTKDDYFYLLKKIKELSKKQLSCTLRLYPYKYTDAMGVPPVDRAMLMCYNLIQPLSQENKNSILDTEELKKYLTRKTKYPVALDIALPVFFWSQWFQNNEFRKLLDKPSSELAGFTKEISPMWYEVTKDTTIERGYYESTFFKAGDRIKCEEVSAETLLKTLDLIYKTVELDKSVTVSLFDLDASTFKKYSNEEIISFYSALSK